MGWQVLKIVFGFPMMAHEDDPVRAVHCAIEIRKALKTINVQVPALHLRRHTLFTLVQRSFKVCGSLLSVER